MFLPCSPDLNIVFCVTAPNPSRARTFLDGSKCGAPWPLGYDQVEELRRRFGSPPRCQSCTVEALPHRGGALDFSDLAGGATALHFFAWSGFDFGMQSRPGAGADRSRRSRLGRGNSDTA